MNQIEYYTEDTQEGGVETTTFFLKLKDGSIVNLSSKFEEKIIDIHEIYREELIFLSLDENTDHEYIGIFSISKNKLIFPAIITEFHTNDESGFIFIQIGEDMMGTIDLFKFELNPNNDFAYLHKTGDIFQNEGYIEEQYGKYYILSQENSDLLMVYSHSFDEEDCIGHRDLVDYYVEGENLCLEKSNGETIRLKLTGNQD